MPFINFSYVSTYITREIKKKSMLMCEISSFAFNLGLRMDKATPLTEIKIQVCVKSESVKVLIPNPT